MLIESFTARDPNRSSQTPRDARQIGRRVVGGAVCNVFLHRAAAKAGEGQHDNRQARRQQYAYPREYQLRMVNRSLGGAAAQVFSAPSPRDWRHSSSASSAFAPLRSGVSEPSVNQP
jgi:hypothetical protein